MRRSRQSVGKAAKLNKLHRVGKVRHTEDFSAEYVKGVG